MFALFEHTHCCRHWKNIKNIWNEFRILVRTRNMWYVPIEAHEWLGVKERTKYIIIIDIIY